MNRLTVRRTAVYVNGLHVGASEGGGGYGTPLSPKYRGKYVSPPHEIFYNKFYIYLLNLVYCLC